MLALMAHNQDRIYHRQLPGGGYVAIEVTPLRTLFGQRRYRGTVVVERRAEGMRRDGHTAPRIAEFKSATLATLFHELFPLAHSNCVVAARLAPARNAR